MRTAAEIKNDIISYKHTLESARQIADFPVIFQIQHIIQLLRLELMILTIYEALP